jgi:hypothetical protein
MADCKILHRLKGYKFGHALNYTVGVLSSFLFYEPKKEERRKKKGIFSFSWGWRHTVPKV